MEDVALIILCCLITFLILKLVVWLFQTSMSALYFLVRFVFLKNKKELNEINIKPEMKVYLKPEKEKKELSGFGNAMIVLVLTMVLIVILFIILNI